MDVSKLVASVRQHPVATIVIVLVIILVVLPVAIFPLLSAQP
jgi:hypothetical protein